MSAKMTIRPTHPVQSWRNIWKPLLLYFWQCSCRLGNCMSVWTQYENFNFIPAKKAIFKGQKMTSFPEIKSCYTINKSNIILCSKHFDAPEKNQFLRTRWVKTNGFKTFLKSHYKFILVILLYIFKKKFHEWIWKIMRKIWSRKHFKR